MRHTACLLDLDGSKRTVTQLLERVDCPDCLWMLVHELSEAPLPDWRADRVVGEDYYAV
jgi:hypothetical protein